MQESVRHCSPISWQPSPTHWALPDRNGALLAAVLPGLVVLPPCSRGWNRGRQSGDHAAIRESQQFGRSRYWRRRGTAERGVVPQHRMTMAWEDY
ncbi:hypothetical protein L207DRAFT_156986 [Hyaloscypha variabilis F]|uniref:Uncharacterized protein n=1 Tax=Hyaloscypha variabilis (strain UAMH 11265 / GT02V1 / F) TaxID=1149755 RepID=A0A2J6S9F8_HYAVF|nr:hypothetical protein L207DRAFT_156986 [Hyaloscypha variabilis F]